MIITRALTKRYGAVTAVRSVDLDVREGDRYGLLGPNGSGKTTLVRMLLGLVYATSGEIEVMGQPVPRRAPRCCPRSARWSRSPAAYRTCPAARTWRCSTRPVPAAGPPGAPGASGSTRRWSRSAWPASTAGRSRPTRWACGSASAWPPRCCAGRGC